MTPRDEARRRWQLLAGSGTPDAETLAWLQRVAADLIAADSRHDGNDRHLAIVAASGLTGRDAESAGLPLGLALRGLQALLERPAEPVMRLDDDGNAINDHVTAGQVLAHDRAHALAQQQAARDPLHWLAVVVNVWKPEDTPNDQQRDTFRRRVDRYLRTLDEPTRAEFKALLRPRKSTRTKPVQQMS